MPMPACRPCAVSRGLAALLFALAACGTTPSTDAVRRFSDTLQTVSAETRTGFAVVEEVERRAMREDAALRYVQTGRPTAEQPPVFTAAAATALAPALEALERYAAELTALTGGGQAARLGASAARVGSEVAEAVGRAGFRVSPEVVQRGAAALNELGGLVAEEIVRLSLPAVIDRAQPNIEAIAELMTAVVGRPARGAEPGQGLRGVLDERRRLLAATRRTLLAEMGRSGTPADSYAFYMRVMEAERLEPSDAAFAALEAAIGEMVRAHAALRSPDTARGAVAGFENAARRLQAAWREIRPLLR
jgi:hypothetical protein